MNSVVRSVLGAAILVTGASAAMAASDNAPATNQTVQTGAPTGIAATNNAPVAYQSVQTSASPQVAASNSAPVAAQPKKAQQAPVSDNTDPYGGHDPNSTKGSRAFWEDRNQY